MQTYKMQVTHINYQTLLQVKKFQTEIKCYLTSLFLCITSLPL